MDDFIETVEETALLQLPEKFETEYSSLHEAYEIIKEEIMHILILTDTGICQRFWIKVQALSMMLYLII